MISQASVLFRTPPSPSPCSPPFGRYAHQGVALLPFIDIPLLLEAIRSVEHLFSEEERARNTRGRELLFVHAASPLAPYMCQL